VIVDGTERPIARPKDAEKQKENYSGKKKRLFWFLCGNEVYTDRLSAK